MHLIIGHNNFFENKYDEVDLRLYNYDLPEHGGDWFHIDYTSVDKDANKKPDFVFDTVLTPWTFAEDNKYEVVLDISGNEIMFNENKLKEEYLNEINRILIPGGRFYCERRLDENTRCLYVYTKSKN